MVLDQQIRQQYFNCERRAKTGACLLLGGLVTLVLSLQRATVDSIVPGCGKAPAMAGRARLVLVILAVILGLSGIAAILTLPSGLVKEYPEVSAAAKPSDTKPLPRPVPAAPISPPAPAPTMAQWKRNWPAFRGPDNSGVRTDDQLPVFWSEDPPRNIRWKTAVPLPGMSSPVVWGNRVYLSGATRTEHRAFCFAAEDGKLLWNSSHQIDPAAAADYEAWEEELGDGIHATPTPVLDGRNLYCYYGNSEIAAFDVRTGQVIWTRLLGNAAENMYGIASSLLYYDDTVFALHDGKEYRLIALDAMTGKVKYEVAREANTWASPILAESAGNRYQIVISSNPYLAGFDPATGARIWFADLLMGDVAPSPVCRNGTIFTTFEGCGIYAVGPGGAGEVTSSQLHWKVEMLEKAFFPSVVSPVCDGEFVYIYADIYLACLAATDGEIIYEQELPKAAAYASPAVINNKLYAFSENEVYVIQTGSEFKLLGTCSLDEEIYAAPAFMPGKIFLRGTAHLYGIAASE